MMESARIWKSVQAYNRGSNPWIQSITILTASDLYLVIGFTLGSIVVLPELFPKQSVPVRRA